MPEDKRQRDRRGEDRRQEINLNCMLGNDLRKIERRRTDRRGYNDQKTVNLQELAVSNMREIQAVINLLERKGVLSKKDVLEEVKKFSRNKSV